MLTLYQLPCIHCVSPNKQPQQQWIYTMANQLATDQNVVLVDDTSTSSSKYYRVCDSSAMLRSTTKTCTHLNSACVLRYRSYIAYEARPRLTTKIAFMHHQPTTAPTTSQVVARHKQTKECRRCARKIGHASMHDDDDDGDDDNDTVHRPLPTTTTQRTHARTHRCPPVQR